MALAEADTVPSSSEHEHDDNPAPLPTKQIADRKSSEGRRGSDFSARRQTSLSLRSFTSDSSVSSDPGKVTEVGDLRFLNDEDMPEGQSSILGKGSFAMVRLARRRPVPKRSSVSSAVSGLSCDEPVRQNIVEPDSLGRRGSLGWSMESGGGGENSCCSGDKEDGGMLVAVKIVEKSLLEKCRTIYRDSDDQMQVRTALENVVREIAVMKMIQHPNLVSLYEVIDTGSNRLYMVIEYLPLGEIMTNVKGTGNYKRRLARRGEQKLSGVTPNGHFDEHTAALYFTDIIHGLAHLHKNHIVHRDLKPENILLDSRGFAKISDFGVAHLFEDEMKSAGRSSLDHSHLSSDQPSAARISRTESEYALGMKSMSDMGQLSRTEGTWCFWSPEMCAEDSLIFSGYSADLWSAGICLYIFATGRLPFYSEIPLVLFDVIAEADIKLSSVKGSNELKDMLRQVLAKDPSKRAGVGDCLSHPYCSNARAQRIKELGEEVEKHEEVVVQSEDMRQAFSTTKQQGSLLSLASNLGGRFLSWKKRLSGSQSQRSMSISMSLDHIDEASEKLEASEKRGVAEESPRKKRASFPWMSQKTMSTDDGEEGESCPKNSRRRGLGKMFWKSTGQL